MIKIRQADVAALPALAPASVPPPPAPMPPRIAAFWYDEGEFTPIPPWKLESADDKYIRETMERNGCWTG